MSLVMGDTEPQAIEVFMDLRGNRFARVRRDIRAVEVDLGEDGSQTCWEWDETVFAVGRRTTAKDVEENTEQMQFEAERAAMPEGEWRADVDSMLLDIMEVLV